MPLQTVNFLLEEETIALVDADREWRSRSSFLFSLIAKGMRSKRTLRKVTKVPTEPNGHVKRMVTIYIDEDELARIDGVRGDQPRSDFLRRLVNASLS